MGNRLEFQKWQDDLEERLALHLFNNPEPPPHSNKVVEVVESESLPGCWEIYVDGKKTHSFTGFGAQRRASKRAGELANEG